MKSKRPTKQTKQDKERQKKIEDRLIAEKVKLDHPQGKERFNRVIKSLKKTNN